jgi:hypothetical protein
MKIIKSLVVGLIVFGLNVNVFAKQGDLLPQKELNLQEKNIPQTRYVMSNEQKAFDYALNDINEILTPVNNITQNIDIVTETYKRTKEVIGMMNNKKDLILKITKDIDSDAIKGGIRQYTKGITKVNDVINKIKNSKIMRMGGNSALKSAGKIVNKVQIAQQTTILGNQIKKSLDDGFDFVDIADIGIEVVSYTPIGSFANEEIYKKIKGIDAAINSLEESKRIIFKTNTDFALSTIKNENFIKRINGWGKDEIKKAQTQNDLNNVFDNIINEEIKGVKSSIRMINQAIKDIGNEHTRTEFFGLDVGAEDSYIKSLNSYKSMLENRINNIKNNAKTKDRLREIFNSNAAKHIIDDINSQSAKLIKDTKFMSDKQKTIANDLNTIVNISANIQSKVPNIIQDNKKEQPQENTELAEKKQQAKDLKDENTQLIAEYTKLKEGYAKNPSSSNKQKLDAKGNELNANAREFVKVRDEILGLDNSLSKNDIGFVDDVALTDKKIAENNPNLAIDLENNQLSRAEKLKQIKAKILANYNAKQKAIIENNFNDDDFVDNLSNLEKWQTNEHKQEMQDFYGIGGTQDLTQDEKDLASLENFFDDILGDFNNDEKTEIADNRDENNNLDDDNKKNNENTIYDFPYLGYLSNNELIYADLATEQKEIAGYETSGWGHGRLIRGENNVLYTKDYSERIDGKWKNVGVNILIDENTKGDYQYTDWGKWNDDNVTIDNDFIDGHGYWLIGQSSTDLPSLGSASYKGDIKGIMSSGGNIGGDVSMSINFSSRSLSGVFNMTHNNQNWIKAKINPVIIGTLNPDDIVYDGGIGAKANNNDISLYDKNNTVINNGYSIINIHLFGNHGEEVGGDWKIGDGAKYGTGVFRAKQCCK